MQIVKNIKIRHFKQKSLICKKTQNHPNLSHPFELKMETLAGSRTQKREGNTGPVDPRATNVSFGKEKTLYRSEVAYTHRSMRRLT